MAEDGKGEMNCSSVSLGIRTMQIKILETQSVFQSEEQKYVIDPLSLRVLAIYLWECKQRQLFWRPNSSSY